ncbi:MAG TPA: FtsW/RodA/SpoVE family cell cycle protein [Propionibacterium sp.]|jgi:cell division protein FtsW (lipid II flippase)|nr:FtsW/RodA/SpoVE family cell cycle protein [Propionibacterium sp.]
MAAPEQDVVIVYRKRRNVELAMVVFASVIGVASYLLVEQNLFDRLPDNWPVVAVLWLGIGVAAHAAVRWRAPYADPLILPAVLTLNGVGLAMIHRIDKIPDPVRTDASSQLMWTVMGVILFSLVLIVVRDHRPLQGYTYTLFIFGLILMLLPALPVIGHEVYGARIWIRVGPFSFQPAEVAKLALTVAFASYMVEKREALAIAGRRFLGIDLPRPRDLGPILMMWGASVLVLVFQTDLGTSLLFFGLFVMMLYVATERPSWPILGTVMFAGLAYVGYLTFGHVQRRVNAWLDPFSDIDRNGQIINAQFGFAWGGILGRGWGEGRPGLTTFAKSDFIAAAVGEELGTAGLMAIIMIYAFIVARGLRTALAAKDPFGKLLASGLSFVFALQVFLIIGGVTRLLPLTGLTTPFMSQGGSSLIANWVLMGLLMIISHQARKPVAKVTEDSGIENEATQLIRGAGR